jgi:hypothetical protein
MGGTAKKNLRVFRELCGDENMHKVRIVTTNWSRDNEKEGIYREVALRNSAFKPLINAGAQMFRQDKAEESAHFIMATLIKDEQPMMLKIQKELKAGMGLGETSAGAVIIEELAQMSKKHDEAMAALMEEMEEAKLENNEALRAEIAEERLKLEQLKARAEEDKKRLLNGRVTDESVAMGRQAVEGHSQRNGGQSIKIKTATPVHDDLSRPSNNRDEEKDKTLIGVVFGFVATVFVFVLTQPFHRLHPCDDYQKA